MSSESVLPIASLVVAPVSTVSSPAISLGGAPNGNTQTGLYGSTSSAGLAVQGVAIASVDANGFSLKNSIYFISASGAPTDSVTGLNFAGPGSLYANIANGKLYIQTSLISTPAWVVVGSQS